MKEMIEKAFQATTSFAFLYCNLLLLMVFYAPNKSGSTHCAQTVRTLIEQEYSQCIVKLAIIFFMVTLLHLHIITHVIELGDLM